MIIIIIIIIIIRVIIILVIIIIIIKTIIMIEWKSCGIPKGFMPAFRFRTEWKVSGVDPGLVLGYCKILQKRNLSQ